MVYVEKPFLDPDYVHLPKFKTLKQIVNIERNQNVPMEMPTCESVAARKMRIFISLHLFLISLGY